jgi:predicted transposase/invertase (TIGR01784 family)
MPKKPSKPHDEFFKASFGRKDVALDYLQQMLPSAILAELDLSKLSKVNGSYTSPSLREFFSDLVYECPLKNVENLSVTVSLLFEHKSNVPTYPHFQLLRYLVEAWEDQIKQKKSLTPIIPIVIYHGEEEWKMRNLSEYFNTKLPASLLPFVPDFTYLLTNVVDMPDKAIMTLQRGLLINTLLMMKYIHDPTYIWQNLLTIFTNLQDSSKAQDFTLEMFAYLLKNSELAVEDFHKYIEILPKSLNEDAMTTYEMIEKRVEKRVESKYDKILAEERQKTKESLRSAAKANKRAEEERIRAEEERVRAEEASARAEEEHKRAENERKRMVLRLHKFMQLSPTEIAGITGNEISYIEDVLNTQEEINMDSEETDN